MAKYIRKRDDPGYEEFVSAVRKRDKNTCQMPGCKSHRKLEVHHIVPYSKNTYLRTDPNNGILLCKTHHKEVTCNEYHYIKLFYKIIGSKNE